MDTSPSDDIINEKDTRVTNKDADDDIEECYITETRDDSQDECCGAVLNRGGLISRGRTRVLLTERSLPKDTFSFIFISRPLSVPFLVAIIVFSFQIIIFSLVSVDVIDLSNSKNPFHLPPNVESTVRATQALAIIIAIVTQDDVKKVILILRDGYDIGVPRHFWTRRYKIPMGIVTCAKGIRRPNRPICYLHAHNAVKNSIGTAAQLFRNGIRKSLGRRGVLYAA
jgi:hypothetical protein